MTMKCRLLESKNTQQCHQGLKLLGAFNLNDKNKMSIWLQPLGERKKNLLDSGVRALLKVPEVYLDEATWPTTEPSQGRRTQPPRALVQ
jgi:hypothetical protein